MGPDSSRTGVPEVVVIGVIMVLIYEGEKKKAVFLLLMLHTYIRPVEGLDLCGDDLVAPVPSQTNPLGVWGLVLGPLERGKPTKVGIYDDSVLIDQQPHLGWLGPELKKLKERQSIPRGGAGGRASTDRKQTANAAPLHAHPPP